jgi:hypothetical protein
MAQRLKPMPTAILLCGKKHIHEMTLAEAEPVTEQSGQPETTVEQELETAAETAIKKVEALTNKMEEETDSERRKQLRKERSMWKKHVKLIQENLLPRVVLYQKQIAQFGERNSFSKTDPDATFMRMKEDHMKNGQLKPGYNVQMATQNQFILFYSIHQRPGDTRCFIPHLEKLAAPGLPMPKTVIADAGYGSEENYLYAIGQEKEPRFESLFPYGTYVKEQTRKHKKDLKHAKNWTYDEHEDHFICPNGRRVIFKKYQQKTNASGYEQSYKIYECEDCTGCPLKAQCTKSKGNRQVQ